MAHHVIWVKTRAQLPAGKLFFRVAVTPKIAIFNYQPIILLLHFLPIKGRVQGEPWVPLLDV